MNPCPHCGDIHDESYLFCPVSGQAIMEGQYLEDRLVNRGKLPVGESIDITRDILRALDTIHSAGLLKLNLSPSNVLLIPSDTGETVKLVNEDNLPEETESKPYCAPEQFDVTRQPNPRSDIYAVGAILYRMLTDQVPDGAMESMDSLRREVDPELIDVIEKALSVAIKDRYQTAPDFLRALETLKEAPSAAAPPPPKKGNTPVPKTPVFRPVALDEPDALKAENHQPSIIVNMSGTERHLPFLFSGTFKVIVAIVILLGITIATVVYFDLLKSNNKPRMDKVTITVHIEPADAIVTIDDLRYAKNPVTVEVDPDKRLHTIQATAEGFEQLERDIIFDKTKTVYFVLVEIIDPTPTPDVETFVLEDKATKQAEEQDTEGEDTPVPTAPEPLTVKEIKSLE